MTSLNIANNGITGEAIHGLTTALTDHASCLRELDLSYNEFGIYGINVLAPRLPGYACLTSLFLAHSLGMILESGVAGCTLAGVLPRCTSLTQLDLRCVSVYLDMYMVMCTGLCMCVCVCMLRCVP